MQGKNPLSILITAGGTVEDIDAVRGITNHASGRLGSLIADAFLQGGAQVTYLCGERALRPMGRAHQTVVIRNVAQLARELEALLRSTPFDCVIHSMAVSDFTPRATITVDDLADALARELQALPLCVEELAGRIRGILQDEGRPAPKKIGSASSWLMLLLEQTPKVIGRVKALQPDALLVGFKLLSHAGEQELIRAGQALMEKNGCDLVLANDLSEIAGDDHKALLLDQNGILCRAGTKPEIAGMLFHHITIQLKKRNA